MLLRYVVSNFRSIAHPVEFSMLPMEDGLDDRFLQTISTKAGEWKVLQRGGLFGANASGKSSFVESVRFARNYIVEGQKSGKGTGVDLFRGNFQDLEGIASFQFLFYLDGEVYEYGFSLDRVQVHEEWLSQLTADGFAEMFTRTTHANGKTEIEIGDKLARKGYKPRSLVDVLKASIQENQKNQLFLYKLYDNGIARVEPILNWFRDMQVIFPRSKAKALPIQMRTNENLRQYVGKMLRKMDTGVEEIDISDEEIDFHEYADKVGLPPEMVEEIKEIKNGIVSLNGKFFIFSEKEKEQTVLVQLKFSHRLNHTMAQFDVDEESDGTQRLLDLLPMLFSIGQKSMLYFVDEIDRSLHTKLSQFLLDAFVDNTNEEKSQIIFTAQDVNLIDLNHFRQDEIWFIEKSGLGESKLRPFSDFELKEGQDELKAYLSGRFGAVPVIRERGL